MEYYCRRWLRTHLREYTGMVNLETIGKPHHRRAPAGRTPVADLAGAALDRVGGESVRARGMELDDGVRREGQRVALFGPHGARVTYIRVPGCSRSTVPRLG